jgi:uncharacterized protein
MAYFLVKLIPPRASFIQDVTAEEAALMRAHADYWLPHLSAGLVIAMGPVADPSGGWGVMIANSPSRAWLESAEADDPVIKAGSGFVYENYPMPAVRVAPLEPLAPVSSVSP